MQIINSMSCQDQSLLYTQPIASPSTLFIYYYYFPFICSHILSHLSWPSHSLSPLISLLSWPPQNLNGWTSHHHLLLLLLLLLWWFTWIFIFTILQIHLGKGSLQDIKTCTKANGFSIVAACLSWHAVNDEIFFFFLQDKNSNLT